jgi:mannosyltransferase OCH1-like enzyme
MIFYILLFCVISFYIILLFIDIHITIPKNIFQTWNTLDLPPNMQQSVNKLKAQHPDFIHYLYDDTMCRNFIKKHFDKKVVQAFDTLRPGAYKADIWRYCVLYIKGGIYLDIKYECVNGFSLNQLLDREYFVLDRPGWWKKGQIGIYNGVMVCVAKNPILRMAIDKIVENVEKREYGMNILYPTGPGLLGEVHGNDTSQFVLSYKHPEEIIHSTKGCILKGYTGYRKEQKQFHPLETYHELWPKRKIFN